MQTNFTPEQLKDPRTRRANEVLRSCVHCGFCIATCPTYQVLGDELDSPRGRIYLIKDMLENARKPDEKTVRHVDRCLSCLACMTTCPSNVHYMHLVDHARSYIEQYHTRPLDDRILRWLLAWILPFPKRFRVALRLARVVRPLRRLIPDARLRVMLDMAPAHILPASLNDAPQVFAATGARRARVALMSGCVQTVVNTSINDATIRLLRRHGCDVVIAKGQGCCGALTHHMGKTRQSHASAGKNIRSWIGEMDGEGLDAIVINASGCGTTVKDYGHMFRETALAGDAMRVSALTKDISEVIEGLGLAESTLRKPLRVAYHAACSLQHGQKITTTPKNLLKSAGFAVVEPMEGHLCCGSAGTYNLMQPTISAQLKQRKVAMLEKTRPEVIATGNIGCMVQIGSATRVPVVHTAELLDWATGGLKPHALDEKIPVRSREVA